VSAYFQINRGIKEFNLTKSKNLICEINF